MNSLETSLRTRRDRGDKSFVPYLMAGMVPDWLDHIDALVAAGAAAVEVGIPFSDPILDGVVIQRASLASLSAGNTPEGILAELGRRSVGVPLVVMTYFNIIHHLGLERSAHLLCAGGVSGVILPDLTLEEAGPWRNVAHGSGLDTVLLVAPSSPEPRIEKIAAHAEGFVYAASRMAVTGRADDDGHAAAVVERVRRYSDLPVFVGIGVSTPQQARVAYEFADGAIVGSALVERVLGGMTPTQTEQFARDFVL